MDLQEIERGAGVVFVFREDKVDGSDVVSLAASEVLRVVAWAQAKGAQELEDLRNKIWATERRAHAFDPWDKEPEDG